MKKMKDFFNDEAVEHDDLFIDKMGMGEFYDEIEQVLNSCENKNSVLVLGCGSGLEIERIKFPCDVVGVDISDKMLEVLEKKKLYDGVNLSTICGSFLELDFEQEKYDIVLSCYAMHHFNSEQKQSIYNKIYSALKNGGVFINGDTIAVNQSEEDKGMLEAEKIYKDEGMPFASLHVDVPFCFEHEKEVLRKVGFDEVEHVKEWTNTKIYKCKKKQL